MDISFYKLLHIVALLLLFFAFGGLIQGAWTSQAKAFPHKRVYTLLHGLGLVILLISGFGLLAKISADGSQLPGWAIAKLVIWLCLGLILSPILRKPQLSRVFWPTVILLGSSAAYIGFFHA